MDYLGFIEREGRLFYDTAAGVDPGARVPSCPDWDATDLVWHLGEVHWFWATIVERGLDHPAAAEESKPARPALLADLVDFGVESLERLLTVLRNADDAATVWTWSPEHHSVGFVRRHQVQETGVHRWDLDCAAGLAPRAIAAAAAADSIDEFLTVSLPWHVNPDKPLTGTVHLHCTDTVGEWIVHADGQVDPVHAKGEAAVRGTASDLLLALYRRVEPSTLDVLGDEALASRLFAALTTG